MRKAVAAVKASPRWQLLAAFLLYAALACLTLAPNANYIANDDFFIWPERHWFVGQGGEWFYHLMNFSQERFTNVGDFALFRPLLYLQLWLQDALGRDQRDLFYVIAVGVGVLSVLSTFLLLRRFAGFWPSLLLAAIMLVPPPGTDSSYGYFMSWAQLSAYAWALMLFNAGLLLLPRGQQKRSLRSLIAAGLCFILAGLNHEFVIPALGIMAALHGFWVWRARKDAASAANRQSFFVTAVSFAALGAFAFAHYLVYSDLQAGGGLPWKFTADAFGQLLELAAMPLLPDFLYSVLGVSVALAAGMLILVLLTALKVVVWRRDRILPLLRDPVVLGAFSAAAIIAGGVFVGRILPTAYTPLWYFRLLTPYEATLVLALCALLAARRRLARRAVLVCVSLFLIGGFAVQAMVAHAGNNVMRKANEIAPVVIFADRYLDRHPEACFAGVYPKGFSLLSSGIDPKLFTLDTPHNATAIDTLLEFRSCTERKGDPVYFEVDRGKDEFSIKPMKIASPFFSSPLADASHESAAQPLDFSEPLYQLIGTNIQAYRKTHDLHPSGTLDWDHRFKNAAPWHGEIVRALSGECPCEIRADIAASDAFPQMFNIGFIFGYGTDEPSLLLLFENQVVFGHRSRGELRMSSLGFIPDMRANEHLVVHLQQSECTVFINGHLVGSDTHCSPGAGQIAVLTWDNGTPPERAENLTAAANLPAGSVFAPAALP